MRSDSKGSLSSTEQAKRKIIKERIYLQKRHLKRTYRSPGNVSVQWRDLLPGGSLDHDRELVLRGPEEGRHVTREP